MNKTKNFKETFKTLYSAFKLLGKYKHLYLIGLLLSSTQYVMKFINPITYKFITDIVIKNISKNDYIKFAFILLSFLILIPLFCLGHYLRSIACVKAQNNIQKNIFSHLINMSVSDLSKQHSGVYLTKTTSDILFINKLFKKYSFTLFGKFVVLTTVSSVLLLKTSVKIFIFSLMLGLIFLLVSLFIVPKIKDMEESSKKSITKLYSYILSFLNNVATIKIFNMQDSLINKFSNESNNIAKNKIISKSIIGIWDRIISLLKIIVQPISFVLIMWLIPNELNISEAMFVSGVTGIMTEGLCNFIAFFQSVQYDIICAKRIYNIFDNNLEKNSGYIINKPKNKSDYIIEFNNVSFSCNNRNILTDFNLKIKENQFVAIVGESGSGKSTILKLLQKIYNIDKGEILLYGNPISNYNLNNLRNNFSYVSQENLLFNTNIKDNITLVKNDFTDEEYINALNFSNLNEYEKNDKIKIGENGCMLSGGEKQRISIARAILKSADILLLDEFTSALDNETEQHIFNNLKSLIGKKTILMATHKLNYIENADCIIVINNEKIVEIGKHNELLNLNGYYKELHKYNY